MATRHELIHIDFVANAGKANPVLKSLQVSCNDARIAKEQLDAKLKDAKSMNAPAEVITDLEKKLKSQTTTWQQLERGLREYTKGIDTLSKGIKEFNDGTLDEMSAKFNKAVYNSAKLAQSAVKTGSNDWNQLQRLMDATDRNVTRAREDINLMMQSLKDGSAVSTVQLTRSREVLEDLARLAVTNSEEWRGLRKQFNEVDAAIASVTETEKRLKGEIASENDAIALSNSLTKESIALRHADGEAAMKAAQAERKGVEDTMRGISDRIVLLTKERDGIHDEIELQENLNDIIKERNENILNAQNRKQDAEQRKAQAQATIKEYDEQEKKVQELKLQKKDLEEQQKKETREAEKSAKATEEQNKKQAELTQTVSTLKGEIGGLETSLQGLEEQIKKTSSEPIKPKVDTSKIEELQAKLKAVQDGIAEKNAQIEAESKKGGLANKWQETLTRLQGDKDGRLSPMGLGDDKKQMDDILDVANNFYEIIKKVKGVTEDKFIPAQAAEPIKQLAEYYKITEEEARKLVKTLQNSEVISKRFATFDYNEQIGFLAINKKKGKDDQQIRIEAAQSHMEAAERSEGDLTEKVNKLLADKKKLEEEEVEIKGKLQAATEGVAVSTDKSSSATERRVNLTKKEKEEVKKLTDENNSLTGTIDALKKQLDSLSVSQGKVTESIKDGAEAAKGEAEAMKMTAEEAKDALAKMTDVGTVKATKDGPLEASNLEGAQQALFGIFKGAGANVGNGNFTLTGQDQIRKAIKAFQDKFHIDDDKYAKELMIKLATGKNGGLIRQGVSDVDPITHKPLLQISREEGAWKERLRQQQEYRDIMAGVTTATREQTAADKAQEEVVKSLREAYQREKDALARRNEEYQKRLRQAESMSGSAKKEDGTLTAKGVELEKAEEYRQKYVVRQQEKERKAWEEYQAAKSGNIDVEKSRKQIEEQILTLEQQKAANTERLAQLQEKGTKSTKEQVKADGEAVTTGKNMNELLQEKERITARLTEKQAKLKKAQEDLAKITKEETTAGKEQSSVTEELTKKTEEYNAETEKLANMKEGRNKARGVIRNADRSISNADDAIATLKNEPLPQRKSEAEMGAMKKRVAELTAEVEKETAAFNKNAQAITELNKKETQAAIEMAQSENVSIEKVKQSIELLQKKIQTEATDADTMKLRGEAINRLTERLTQMNAEVVKLSKPVADRLNTKNLGTLNETELQQSIDAAKQLLKTYKTGSDEAKQLAANIVRAEQYIKDTGLEAERQAQRQREAVELMESQLKNGANLTESALKAQVQYWQRLADDPKAAAEAVKQYTANMEQAQALLDKSRESDIRDKAGRLQNMDNYSEGEIREAIEAGKQLIQTYGVGGSKAEELAKKIVAAEEHLKKYGLEAERAAVREAKALEEAAKKRQESDDLMKQQLQQGASLSREALKTQEQYWKHLIDDPKTAASSLADYQYQLDRVRLLQQMMQQQEGRDALDFFKNSDYKNASADEIKRQSDALKKYRDSLPQQDEADTIQEINELLIKAGVAAQKAAGETMTFKQALRIGMDAKGGNFKGTVEQLTQAKKTLEQLQQTAVKGGLEWRRMQDGIDSINLELKRTSYLSKEVQDILDKPKGRSLNALKQAVEQGRAALQNMDRTTKDGQEAFDELAKKIKETELELKQMSGEAKATTSAFEKAWSRLKTYVGLYVGASVAMQKLTATMGDLMEISDKMGEVRKTTGFTADQVGRLSGELKKFDTRTTLNGLLELSVAAGQLGLKTEEDVLGFTEAANKLMVALPEMGKEGATEMLKVALATGEIDKIRKQMEQGLIDGSSETAVAMEKIGSTIDRLRATSAATAPAITDFVKRVGAVGAQSGISIDQVAALGSTVDALGMRVEMSATALSRMIPAIKNNAYSIGAMIGQTEEEIVRKFENGMGMDVILDIFETIRNNSKTMTGDVEADAEQIEKEFEKAGLKEIMKELNQMGARAGIVFAGLSQNVDELRRQLGVAAEAYEENIAIEMEYQKMNETTAAKWERLKNELEETFVSDTAQRWLGGIIDFLRGIVNFISGDVNPVLKGLRDTIATIGIAWFTLFKLGIGEAIFKATGGLKNLLAAAQLYVGNVKAWIVAEWQLAVAKDAEAKATARATIAQLGWNKAMATNVILAVASALLMAYLTLKDWIGGCESAKNAMSDLNEKVDEEKRKLDNLVNAYHDANGNLDKRKNLLNEINQKYSKYLGFLLTDANNSNLVAAAHERIAAALQKEMYERERAQSESKVRQDFREDLSENWQEFTDELREYGLNAEEVAQARNAIQGFLHTVSYDDSAKKFIFADGTKEGIVNYMRNEHRSINASLSDADAEEIMALWVYQYLETTFGSKLNAGALKDIVGVSMITNSAGKGWDTAKAGSEFRGDYADYYTDMLEQIGKFNDDVNGAIAAANAAIKEGNEKMIPELKKQAETAIKTIQGNLNATDEEISAAYENLAAAIDGLEKISSELPQIAEKEGQSTSGDIVSYITGLFSGNPRVNTQKVTDARARLSSLWSRINQQRNGTNDNGGGNDKPRGPYGNYDKRVDPYEQWDANALVKRREDMLMRVRALAEGADVQTVLSMDKRFMDEATRKGIKNMRDAIAWYNEERLKIQEELHSRNLTNEGQWMDPKKGRSRKPKTPESEEAIAELDRYYLERKERIEEARANEEMTEAEYNRRLDALEQEHLERRSALRQTFTSKDKQFIQQFRQWWASVEELDEVSWETIEAEWLAAFDRDRKYNNRAAQKDLTQMQAIVVKQLREIEAIIDKERPFNGITRNLQDNLTKMGLLFKDGVPEDDKFMQENTRRLTFLLHEAENAYKMTFDQLAEDMRKNGLGAWADAITGSENAEEEKRAVIAQLHEVYDAVQEAIKKEASLVKKHVDITWNDALLPNGKSIKQTYEAAISQLGIREGSVSRANSLIGAGTASQRVADRLAIRQMQMQLAMQEHYYNLVRQTGLQRIDDLKEQARLKREQGKMDEADRMELDAQHATMSLNLSLSKEQTELDKQREEIIARTEESQNRLYTSLREWADLLSSSVQSLFEASHAGEAEYYNELAKLNLTGKGGPGAGTYVVIDNEGTEDATAHYEYLSESEALEREREIERQNAMADAWRKVMDDINAKMNEQITDWMNAALQNQSIDANTKATLQNTEAIAGLTNAIVGNSSANDAGAMTGAAVSIGDGALNPAGVQECTEALGTEPWLVWEQTGVSAMQHVQQVTADTSKRMTTSTQSAFAKMTQAANLYGIAYSAMSNDNLSTKQKFDMIAVQSAGQAAISMLTADLAAGQAKNTVQLPGILGKLLGEMPYPVAMATFAIVSGLLGGLMGIAVSKVTKSKAQIAQATGAGGANAGRLTTGMLAYATGNVNEFTDPSTLTPGRTYNVDAADGKTYRAKYTGRNPKTHITNGPEFHLAGEAGREMIIDAGTTRQITMNDTEIWHAIQTLSGGGRMRLAQRQGVRAFADGNIADFEDSALSGASNGMTPEQMMAFQLSLDRNNELLERALTNGIKAVNKWDGPDGIPNMYNRMEKEARRHGVKYL